MMKQIVPLLLFLFISTGFANQSTYINPTGTYALNGNIKKDINSEIYGYFGEIQVINLEKDKIIMFFEICKGAPSYNSGIFLDTLLYKNNRAIYKGNSIDDPSCMITFDFTTKGVSVDEKTDDYSFGCGFGHAVFASGFFKKKSSDVPVIEELRFTK